MVLVFATFAFDPFMGSDHFLSNVLGFHPCTVYMPLFRSKEEAAGSYTQRGGSLA